MVELIPHKDLHVESPLGDPAAVIIRRQPSIEFGQIEWGVTYSLFPNDQSGPEHSVAVPEMSPWELSFGVGSEGVASISYAGELPALVEASRYTLDGVQPVATTVGSYHADGGTFIGDFGSGTVITAYTRQDGLLTPYFQIETPQKLT
jgi:hypothetical protein